MPVPPTNAPVPRMLAQKTVLREGRSPRMPVQNIFMACNRASMTCSLVKSSFAPVSMSWCIRVRRNILNRLKNVCIQRLQQARHPRRYDHWPDIIVTACRKRALGEVTDMCVQQKDGLAVSNARSQDHAELSYNVGKDFIVNPCRLSTPQFGIVAWQWGPASVLLRCNGTLIHQQHLWQMRLQGGVVAYNTDVRERPTQLATRSLPCDACSGYLTFWTARAARAMRGMRAVETVCVAQIVRLDRAAVRAHRVARSPPAAQMAARSHLLLPARHSGAARPTRVRRRAHVGWLGGGRARRRPTGLFS